MCIAIFSQQIELSSVKPELLKIFYLFFLGFPCKICEEKFPSPVKLEVHMANSHEILSYEATKLSEQRKLSSFKSGICLFN